MAKPSYHAIHTVLLVMLYILATLSCIFCIHSYLVIAAVIFLGIFIDIDHVGSLKNDDIKAGKWLEMPNHVNWLHTKKGLLVALLISFLLLNYIPFLSFAIHMFVDGANRANRYKPTRSPLPAWLHHFYPRALTYHY
jgi:hypothetical protein